jgi:hypothetical protein
LRINEKQTVFSVGFAIQMIQNAQKPGSDLIAIMSVTSEEYHYFAQQDKESLEYVVFSATKARRFTIIYPRSSDRLSSSEH